MTEFIISRDYGLPSRAGYDYVSGVGFVPPADLHPDEAGPVGFIDRVLTLKPPCSLSAKALAFGPEDNAGLVEFFLRSANPPAPDLIASCDFNLDRERKQVMVKLVMHSLDPGPGERMAPAIKALFDKGFDTASKLTLKAESYTAVRMTELARVCRVVTTTSVDRVRDAFVARGVPSSDILSVEALGVVTDPQQPPQRTLLRPSSNIWSLLLLN